MKVLSALSMLLLIPATAVAQGLEPVGADGYSDEAYTLTVSRIEQALEEYRKVMDPVRKTVRKRIGSLNARYLPDSAVVQLSLTAQELRALNGFAWDAQYIGYPNSLRTLKGYPHFRRAELLQAKLEILKLNDAAPTEIGECEIRLAAVLRKVEKYKAAIPID